MRRLREAAALVTRITGKKLEMESRCALMAERKVLFNPILVGRVHSRAASQTAPTFWSFGFSQMTPTGTQPQHFAARGYLEPFRGGFLGLVAFWTSHKSISFLSKRARNIGGTLPGSKS